MAGPDEPLPSDQPGDPAAEAAAADPARAGAKRKRKHKRGPPEWTHGAIYAAVRSAAGLLQVFGVDETMRVMRGLGGVYARAPFNRARLARAVDNLAWCFPDWEREKVDRYAVEAYRHMFCLAAEVARTPRLLTEEGYSSRAELGDLRSALRTLIDSGPCLMVTGHCGNWELLGTVLALLGFPMHALYRPLDMKPLDRWLARTRASKGLVLVDKFGATTLLPQLIEAGNPVGFIADQNAGDKGLFVPFFGRLASAYKTIGLLAMRYRAPILCGQAVRVGRAGIDSGETGAGEGIAASFRYRLDMADIIRPEEWEAQPDPLFYITARYRRAIETMVRRAPEQYLWMHRYWKSRPVHERNGKPFPASLRRKIESLPWMTGAEVERLVDRSARDAQAMSC